jgi:hypothetical protein
VSSKGRKLRLVVQPPLVLDAALTRSGLDMDPERFVYFLAGLVRSSVKGELLSREVY